MTILRNFTLFRIYPTVQYLSRSQDVSLYQTLKARGERVMPDASPSVGWIHDPGHWNVSGRQVPASYFPGLTTVAALPSSAFLCLAVFCSSQAS